MARIKNPFEIEANLLSALAHPTRLEILEVLRDGEACVCHIQATLRQRQAYISQQLMALRQAGLVTSRKEGLRVYYQLGDPQVLAVLDEVRSVAGLPAGKRAPRAPRGACNCPQCAE